MDVKSAKASRIGENFQIFVGFSLFFGIFFAVFDIKSHKKFRELLSVQKFFWGALTKFSLGQHLSAFLT